MFLQKVEWEWQQLRPTKFFKSKVFTLVITYHFKHSYNNNSDPKIFGFYIVVGGSHNSNATSQRKPWSILIFKVAVQRCSRTQDHQQTWSRTKLSWPSIPLDVGTLIFITRHRLLRKITYFSKLYKRPKSLEIPYKGVTDLFIFLYYKFLENSNVSHPGLGFVWESIYILKYRVFKNIPRNLEKPKFTTLIGTYETNYWNTITQHPHTFTVTLLRFLLKAFSTYDNLFT